MLISRELSNLKESILDKVALAAGERDLDAVARWSTAAKECEELEKEAENLENRVSIFKESLEGNSGPISGNNLEAASKPKPTSAKLEGQTARSEWTNTLASKGVQLVGHGKRYLTIHGKEVGIAFANELDGIDGKWFLGLKDESTDVVVLICKSKKGDIYDLVIPVQEITKFWSALSRSKGQIKFNVRKKDSDFMLLVPGYPPLVTTRFISNYAPLR